MSTNIDNILDLLHLLDLGVGPIGAIGLIGLIGPIGAIGLIRQQERAIPVAQETEVMRERILIHPVPVLPDQRRYQQ